MMTEARKREIQSHFARLWGEPRASREFGLPSPAPDKISVLAYRYQESPQEWAYATIGMSEKALTHPSPEADLHVELFVLAKKQDNRIAESLAGIAAYPFIHGTYFNEGHTVHGSPGHGIIDRSPLTDLVLTRADFGSVADFVKHNDGTHTHLFWVVPIYPTEREFVVEKGWASMRRLFEEKSTDVLNLRRKAVI
jgi:hypothetical protein